MWWRRSALALNGTDYPSTLMGNTPGIILPQPLRQRSMQQSHMNAIAPNTKTFLLASLAPKGPSTHESEPRFHAV